MNPLEILQAKVEAFSNVLISFCKPFMLDKKYSLTITQLLNSESNVRMTIDFAKVAETAAECQEKLELTIEELMLMQYFLKSLEVQNSEQVHMLYVQLEELNNIVAELIRNIPK